MSKKQITVWFCVCGKCEHNWRTKTDITPRICPKCKSVKWDSQTLQDKPETAKPILTIKPAEKTEIKPFISKTEAIKPDNNKPEMSVDFDLSDIC